jgi:two-component system, NarL family, nitrate/nitrite response regulator NarL
MAPNTGATPITIIVAVAVRLYREGLASTLEAYTHLRIEGTAATPVDAQAAVCARQPAVIIVDVGLEDVLGLMRTLRALSPNTRIVAFAVREEISAILDYAEAGADGFVTANSSVAELVEAIERTAAGELLCSPRIAAQLLRRAAHRPSLSPDTSSPGLTHREQQVLSLLKQGHSNKEIASALKIAEATVKNHVHHVLEKLQVTTRGQAAASVPTPAVAAALKSRSSTYRAS